MVQGGMLELGDSPLSLVVLAVFCLVLCHSMYSGLCV